RSVIGSTHRQAVSTPQSWHYTTLSVRLFFFSCYGHPRHLHSFPTRRSSDLSAPTRRARSGHSPKPARVTVTVSRATSTAATSPRDRKSTRLNSSHVSISYAVFCLKKKTCQHLVSAHKRVIPRQPLAIHFSFC